LRRPTANRHLVAVVIEGSQAQKAQRNLALRRRWFWICRYRRQGYTPKITTISLPAIEMGRMGTEFLINQLEDPNFKTQQVILPPQFIVRQSTGPRKNQEA
jgi:hypothetical protein